MIRAIDNGLRKYRLAAALATLLSAGTIHSLDKAIKGNETVAQELRERKEWNVFINERFQTENPVRYSPRSKAPTLEDEINRNKELLTKNPANKSTLESAASRATRFSDYIGEASKKTGLYKNLITAIILTESKGHLSAESSKGAGGPMQIMPKTGEYLGLEIGEVIDERFSPKSILAGARYMKELLDNYKSLPLALAAYNMGPTSLDNTIEKHGREWSKIEPNISEETRNHVIRILSRKVVLDNAKKYGIRINQEPLFSEIVNNSTVHHTKMGETLDQISITYGVPVSEIKEINPMIKDYSKIWKHQQILIPRG